MVSLISEVAGCSQVGSIYIVDMLHKGLTHVSGGTEQGRMRFIHAIQNGTQTKTYQLFIPGIFHVVFLGHG